MLLQNNDGVWFANYAGQYGAVAASLVFTLFLLVIAIFVLILHILRITLRLPRLLVGWNFILAHSYNLTIHVKFWISVGRCINFSRSADIHLVRRRFHIRHISRCSNEGHRSRSGTFSCYHYSAFIASRILFCRKKTKNWLTVLFALQQTFIDMDICKPNFFPI